MGSNPAVCIFFQLTTTNQYMWLRVQTLCWASWQVLQALPVSVSFILFLFYSADNLNQHLSEQTVHRKHQPFSLATLDLCTSVGAAPRAQPVIHLSLYSGSQNCPNVWSFWIDRLSVEWWHKPGFWSLCPISCIILPS